MAKYASNDTRILAAMDREPRYFSPSDIAAHLGMSKSTVSCAFGRLLMLKDIVFVGTAQQGAIKGVRSHTKFYGLPGAPPFVTKPEAGPVSEQDQIRVAQKITIGRGSYWGAGLA